MYARQAQRAQLGTYWSSQLSPTSLVRAILNHLNCAWREVRSLSAVVCQVSLGLPLTSCIGCLCHKYTALLSLAERTQATESIMQLPTIDINTDDANRVLGQCWTLIRLQSIDPSINHIFCLRDPAGGHTDDV